MPHSEVSALQRGRAKQLRQRMTRAETLLWRYLKAHRIDDLSFRRQAPIGRYIVDFVCHAQDLVVELDGETHDFAKRQDQDAKRDAWLVARGYRVLRFTNNDVLRNLDGVVEQIRQAVFVTPPSLTLPRKGGGNDSRSMRAKPTSNRA